MSEGSRKPRRWSAAADLVREELLRPCPYLGYDHERIGVHCLIKEAFEIAERSFRRAIWLNPYEPRFVLHLAHALLGQKRHEDALATLDELRDGWPGFRKGDALREIIMAMMRRTADCEEMKTRGQYPGEGNK
jgi:tetratricopeptide (TPR) repeat protein